MELKIIEVCHVSLPMQTAAPISVQLTFFDLLWLKMAPVQYLFFYKTQDPQETIFSQLKKSLTLTLQHFPVLAGHLTWPDTCPTPIVGHDNRNTLALTLAKSNSDFRHLSSNELRLADESHPLVPSLPIESNSKIPVLAVQVTVFENAGFCIGITTHHAFIDGNSAVAFIKTWASFSKFGENKEPALCFDRNGRFSDVDNLHGENWLENVENIRENLSPPVFVPPPEKVRGTFEFNDLQIKKLKEFVINNNKEVSIPRVTSFVAVYAYVLVCLVKAKKAKTQIVLVLTHADYRSRLDPPLPVSYFGNCIQPCPTGLETKDLLGEDGFVYATCTISDSIKRFLSTGIEGAKDWLKRFDTREPPYAIVSMAGSNRFGFYGINFGWGRPMRVEITSISATGAIGFSEGKDGSGIEIGLALNKDEMETFASLFEQGLSEI